MFGSAARATFTFIIFAFEITRDYNAILPLMLVCVIADGIAILLMRNSIMTEKLARRGLHIPQEYEADVFRAVKVGEVMETQLITLPANLLLDELADRIARKDPALNRHPAFPLVDEAGRLAGIVTRGDVLRALEAHPEDGLTVLEAGNNQPWVSYPDESVQQALVKMLQNDIGRLPVVNRADPTQLVGYLSRANVLSARRRRFHEEYVREPGWIARIRS
jgi:CBS domain-containing protein